MASFLVLSYWGCVRYGIRQLHSERMPWMKLAALTQTMPVRRISRLPHALHLRDSVLQLSLDFTFFNVSTITGNQYSSMTGKRVLPGKFIMRLLRDSVLVHISIILVIFCD